MTKLIQVKGSVIVAASAEKAFDFLANLENDRLWRKEINLTTMSGEIALGVKAEESTYFSRRNSQQLLHLECTHYLAPQEIIYTTVTDSPHYLKSIRKIESLSNHQSRFVYEVHFSTSIVKAGIGISLPGFIIQLGAERDLKKYLKQVASVLR